MYYFAYGSNMNIEQMEYRCPGAIPLGAGILRDYTLVERRYADIDYQAGAFVHGVVWEISQDNLRWLDSYEGYPELYRRFLVEIIFAGSAVSATVYEMTAAAKQQRDGEPYSPEYRAVCSAGAVMNGVEDNFKLTVANTSAYKYS
jgi:gamma-glutamylcyclotransferase (GGCT)/AIG2-like uncharacterized protein YtfP